MIMFVILFGGAIAIGYYYQTARHRDCAARGGTWVSTSTKDGYCEGVPPIRLDLGQ